MWRLQIWILLQNALLFYCMLHTFAQVAGLLLSRVLVLVLVVDERSSFSAIDAHIFPCLIQAVSRELCSNYLFNQ